MTDFGPSPRPPAPPNPSPTPVGRGRRPARSSRQGFVLVELLVVLVLIGILMALLLPPTLNANACLNQEAAGDRIAMIASAEDAFRAGDLDQDGLDDYATLDELVAAGLVPSELALGITQGYAHGATPYQSPTVSFVATAVPLSSATGGYGFRVDESGVILHSPSGALPTSDAPEWPDDGSCPPRAGSSPILTEIHSEAIALIDGLGGGGHLGEAAALRRTEPELVAALVGALDGDGGGGIETRELLHVDLLEAARAVVTELGLPPGPVLGEDDDLRQALENVQASVVEELRLDLEDPQVAVPIEEIPVPTFFDGFESGTTRAWTSGP